MSRFYAHRLIEAAEVTTNLLPIGNKLPISEYQARPLTSLSPEAQREVWERAVETAPDGKITAAHVQSVVNETKDFNYKRDMRRSAPQDIYKPLGMDACQTPAYALDPLFPYLTQFRTIWEPAAGEGLLRDAFYDCTMKDFHVIDTDLITGRINYNRSSNSNILRRSIHEGKHVCQ